MKHLSLLAILVITLLTGCTPEPEEAPSLPVELAPLQAPLADSDWQSNADQQLQQAAAQWQQALDDFLQHGSTRNLETVARQLQHWYQQLNQHYLLLATRACANRQLRTLARIDSWPLYPGYLDSQPDWPDSGMINDPTLDIDDSTLRSQHQATDEGEISLGFQALFVMLYGDGSSLRPAADFKPPEQQGSSPLQQRRQQFLRLVSTQLHRDIQSLAGPELTLQHLQCGLDRALQRQQSLEHWQAEPPEPGESIIPAASQPLLSDSLAQMLKALPDSLIEQWETQQEGQEGVLQQAREGNYQALEKALAM